MLTTIRSWAHWLCPLLVRPANQTARRSSSRSPRTSATPPNQSVDHLSLGIDNQSNNQVSNQTVTVNLDQPAKSYAQALKQSLSISTDRSVNQTNQQPVNQTADQSDDQLIDQSDEEPLTPLSPNSSAMLKRALANYSCSSDRSRDIEAYIRRYPGQSDNRKISDNLQFYRNELKSRPQGDFVEQIHQKWWGDYDRLEVHHGYIQWLFPIREPGMNSMQHPLQMHEIEAIRADPDCQKRLLQSYRLMLDFYGFVLHDEETGRLKRSPQYKSRISNLIRMSHNYLRVTRILKCLGELGYEHLKLGFCLALWTSCRVKSGRSMRNSALEYWFKTLRDQYDRDLLDAVVKEEREMKTWGQYCDILKESIAHRESLQAANNEEAAEHKSLRRSLPVDDNTIENPSPMKRRRESVTDESDSDMPPDSQSSSSTVGTISHEEL